MNERVYPLRRLAIFGLGRSIAGKEANIPPLRRLAVIFVSKWLCCMCVFRVVPASSTEVVRVWCTSRYARTGIMMPVPAVSPKNWARTKIVCSFEMGTSLRLANELCFQDRLETVLDEEDSYLEEAREVEEENRESEGFNTHTEFQGTPEDPHQVPLRLTQREVHRPNVDEQTVQRLQQAVMEEKPSVPAKKLDFDTNLDIVLSAAERYYEALQCEIVQTRSTVGGETPIEDL